MNDRFGTTPPSVVFLVGTTASGKKKVAARMREALGAEWLSLDAIKVYRGMNIGAAKTRREGLVDGSPMHLIDLVDPSEVFSTGRYVEEACRRVADIYQRGNRPLFVGGTGLYLQSLVRGFFEAPEADPGIRERLRDEAEKEGRPFLHRKLQQVDPETAAKVGENDLHRILRALEVYELTQVPISTLRKQTTRSPIQERKALLGIRWDRDCLFERIEARVLRMYEDGILDECERLLEGPELSPEAAKAIGYREGFAFLRGELSREQAVERTVFSTRQFARRQRNWFRQFPEIHWIDAKPPGDPEELAEKALLALREVGEH